jgi:hypothetical protein
LALHRPGAALALVGVADDLSLLLVRITHGEPEEARFESVAEFLL